MCVLTIRLGTEKLTQNLIPLLVGKFGRGKLDLFVPGKVFGVRKSFPFFRHAGLLPDEACANLVATLWSVETRDRVC